MPNLELANFVCKFGEDKVLLDFYEQVVLPAFKTKDFRKWRNNEYVLHQVKENIIKDGDKEIRIISGRIIKNTTLISRQILIDGELVQRKKRLKTSPSSFFILYVDSHKFAFVPEMSFSPSISDFEYSMAWFLKKSHTRYLKILQGKTRSLNKEEKTIVRFLDSAHAPTLKKLKEIVPTPTLTITSIGVQSSLAKFINSYDILKSVNIQLLPVNEEIDSDDLFRALRAEKEKVRSTTTSLVHKNTKDGLNKKRIIDHLSSINAAGNHLITTSGFDDHGNTQQGSNADFKLKRSVESLPPNTESAGAFVHGEIIQMIQSGIIGNIL